MSSLRGGRGERRNVAFNALKKRPDLLIHTGYLTHLSTPKEFDTVAEILNGAKVGLIACVPGEYDVIGNSTYLAQFGKGTHGEGRYSFNHRGVHFIEPAPLIETICNRRPRLSLLINKGIGAGLLS